MNSHNFSLLDLTPASQLPVLGWHKVTCYCLQSVKTITGQLIDTKRGTISEVQAWNSGLVFDGSSEEENSEDKQTRNLNCVM